MSDLDKIQAAQFSLRSKLPFALRVCVIQLTRKLLWVFVLTDLFGFINQTGCLGCSGKKKQKKKNQQQTKTHFRKKLTASHWKQEVCRTRTYPRNRLRYCLLQVDQKKTPLFPARVGDMMLPSVLRQGFPSPSWIIPKLDVKEKFTVKTECKGQQ